MSDYSFLGSLAAHTGADHHAVTPQTQLPPSAGYQMPHAQMGVDHAAAPPPPGVSMADRFQAGMASPDIHPYEAPPSEAYQPIQFQQPQMGSYQPQYQNLAHLLQGG